MNDVAFFFSDNNSHYEVNSQYLQRMLHTMLRFANSSLVFDKDLSSKGVIFTDEGKTAKSNTGDPQFLFVRRFINKSTTFSVTFGATPKSTTGSYHYLVGLADYEKCKLWTTETATWCQAGGGAYVVGANGAFGNTDDADTFNTIGDFEFTCEDTVTVSYSAENEKLEFSVNQSNYILPGTVKKGLILIPCIILYYVNETATIKF
jgi:hypothetical protein